MRARWVWVVAPIAVLVLLLAFFAIDHVVEAQPPNPPTNVTTSANGTAQVVKFTPPTDQGDSAITSYLATCTSDDMTSVHTKQGSASPIAVSGMSTGTTYTCAVAATNKSGTSRDSDPSAPFVYRTKPGVPQPVSAVPCESGAARIVWGLPAGNRCTPIHGLV